VVAAGSGGGRGWIAVDDLSITPLPVPPAVPPAPVISGGDGAPLLLDLGYRREFGGLKLRWAGEARDYSVQLSDDRRAWRTVREVRGSDGGTDWIRLEESEARFVRIVPAAPSARLQSVEVQPIAFGASRNAFVGAVAAAERRGLYPRGFVGEQNYWTLAATPEGGNSGLIDESGAIEVGRGGFSVEPFILEDGRLLSWADVAARQTLLDGELPVPSVEWRGDDWSLVTTAFADGEGESRRLIGRYALRNGRNTRRVLTLVLAVRPFQVNPPQQFLNITGGVSEIEALRFREGALEVNGRPRLVPLAAADRVAMSAFDAGMLPQALERAGELPVEDPTGLASAAFVYRLSLGPGATTALSWVAPLGDAPPSRQQPAPPAEAGRRWRVALGDVALEGPSEAQPLLRTVRTALAHILATREGPALRPGSRAYARSWIRDGAMMSTALLRMGLADPAERFLLWYAPHQYPSGKVPCCVDARGADPVPEHDSDGELIHLVAQLHRFAPDRARLEQLWPRVLAAAGHIEALRQRTRIPANRAGATRHFYGLLPPSISHEGYSARPMHSYWDDFWALAGLRDAAWLALQLGRAGEARTLEGRAEEFAGEIRASIQAARQIHGIPFIPGAADIGDFDATSTTIALSVAGEQHRLPQAALAATFERYWREAVARRDGTRQWGAYTPYEWRNVGAFVRLGWRERAAELIDMFMADRRPAGWNQWAEVVGREPREPRFLGDMPHGWVASDFINAALDMLAFERPRDEALVLAAGVPRTWLDEGGISVSRLRTPYGRLSFSLRAEGGRALLEYDLDGAPPPGGLVLGLTEDGRRLAGNRGRIAFALP
ncbi:MAG TPA: discoidin domain-containing protein, partial [Allosphingosinicella sp.]